MWNDTCNALTAAWSDIVINNNTPSPPSPSSKSTTSSSPPSNRKNSFLSNNSDSRPDPSELKADGDSNSKSKSDEKQLRGIFILGSLIAGQENGFALPPAGGDGAWIKENRREFERLAGEGDEDMKEMLEELGRRGMLK